MYHSSESGLPWDQGPIDNVSFLSLSITVSSRLSHPYPLHLDIHRQVNSQPIYCPVYQKVTTTLTQGDTARSTHHPTRGRPRNTPTPVLAHHRSTRVAVKTHVLPTHGPPRLRSIWHLGEYRSAKMHLFQNISNSNQHDRMGF